MPDIVALGEPLIEFNQARADDPSAVPARVRRRHVEHGDRRRAPRRARGLRDATRQRRVRPHVRRPVDARRRRHVGRRVRCGSADGRVLRHARSRAVTSSRICVRAVPRAACVPRNLPDALLRSARLVHASGISQAISASACDSVFAAFDDRRASAARSSPTIPTCGASCGRSPARRRSSWRRWRMCTWCLPSEDDAAMLFGDASCRRRDRRGASRRRARRGAEAGRGRMHRVGRVAARAHRRAPRARASTPPARATASTAHLPRASWRATIRSPRRAMRMSRRRLATTGYGAVAPLPRARDVERALPSSSAMRHGPEGACRERRDRLRVVR